jgi:hypothetical protein
VGFGEISRSQPLVEHWDGKVWAIVSGPMTNRGQPDPGIIETVAAIAPNDVWVAWDRNVFRWDGIAWTALPSPGRVLDLAAHAPNDVWAAGGVLAHWDGKKWTTIALKPGLPKGSALNALAIAPSRDVWTVGGIGYAQGHQHPFAVRKCNG